MAEIGYNIFRDGICFIMAASRQGIFLSRVKYDMRANPAIFAVSEIKQDQGGLLCHLNSIACA